MTLNCKHLIIKSECKNSVHCFNNETLPRQCNNCTDNASYVIVTLFYYGVRTLYSVNDV